MSIASSVVSVVLKSAVGDRFGSGLFNELAGIAIGEVSDKGINEITDFINEKKSKIDSILSKENLKFLGIPENKIAYVVTEIKELLSKIDITDEVLRQCKYDSMNLSAFLCNEYRECKNDYIEYESEIKRCLFAVAEALIKLVRESEEFEKKFLIQISNTVDDTNLELQNISDYMKKNFGKLDNNSRIMLELLVAILEQIQKMNMQGNESKSITDEEKKFKNNKKEDYIKKWNNRLFLHIDNDENPVTLADAFIMPDYIRYQNGYRIEFWLEDKLHKLISKFIRYNRNSTLLIQGVPGMGKSSIIAWIANKYKDDNRILILRFRDWEYEDLQDGLLKAILSILKCKKNDLEGKILILDGFDEIKSVNNRKYLLNCFFNDILDYKNFKVIITSRPDYLEAGGFKNAVSLLPFDINRICKFYQIIKGEKMNADKISDISIIGIPVILYMAIMSDIDISEDATKPELYSRIFAETGGIFDRFSYKGDGYDQGTHPFRNRENVEAYLKFLKEIAFKMFEKDKLCLQKKECQIPELKFQGGYISVLEFPIKCLFETVELNIEFIHKSIYDFFVSEYILEKLNKNINQSREHLARVFGKLFKSFRLSNEIIEFLKYKFKAQNSLVDKFDMVCKTFQLMLEKGMTFYTEEHYENIIECEMNVFANMLDILHLPDSITIELNVALCKYLKYNRNERLNLKSIRKNNIGNMDLRGLYLVKADISNSYMQEVDISGSDLRGACIVNATFHNVNLARTNLSGANITNTNLLEVDFTNSELKETEFEGVDFRKVCLKTMNIADASLIGGILDEEQISYLEEKECNLLEMNVYIKESQKIITYEEYKIRKIKNSISSILK